MKRLRVYKRDPFPKTRAPKVKSSKKIYRQVWFWNGGKGRAGWAWRGLTADTWMTGLPSLPFRPWFGTRGGLILRKTRFCTRRRRKKERGDFFVCLSVSPPNFKVPSKLPIRKPDSASKKPFRRIFGKGISARQTPLYQAGGPRLSANSVGIFDDLSCPLGRFYNLVKSASILTPS